jgi:hypothetical protein
MWLSGMAVLFVVASTGVAQADWGDLKLKFTAASNPKLPPLAVTKDPAVCGKMPIPDEAVVVGDDGQLLNVVVYLVPEKGTKVAVHPDYESVKTGKVTLDNKGCVFYPHVALLRTGQSLELKNSDPIGHNSKIDFFANPPVNPIIPGNSAVDLKATETAKAEKRATPVSCSIHPWMKAWILVQDHPYMGVSDANGEVVIKNVPTGKHTFQVWHETVGNLSATNTVDAAGKPVSWSKGKAPVEIKAGANDLGVFKVKL